MTKDEILERYLNTVYFGNGAYGVQAGAETYFGIDAADLDDGQSAFLAGMIGNPAAFDPIRHPEASRRAAGPGPGAAGRRRPPRPPSGPTCCGTSRCRRPSTRSSPTPDTTSSRRSSSSSSTTSASGDDPRGARASRCSAAGCASTRPSTRKAQAAGRASRATTCWPRCRRRGRPAGTTPIGADEDTGAPRSATAAVVSVEPGTGAVRAMVGGPGFADEKVNIATGGQRRRPLRRVDVQDLRADGPARERLRAHRQRQRQRARATFTEHPGPRPRPVRVENFGNSGGGGGHDPRADAALVELRVRAPRPDRRHRQGRRAGPQDGHHHRARERGVDAARHRGGAARSTWPAPSPRSRPTGCTPTPYYVDRVEDHDGRTIFEHEPDRRAGRRRRRRARLAAEVLEANVRSGTGTRARIPEPARGRQDRHRRRTSSDAWFVGSTPVPGHRGVDRLADGQPGRGRSRGAGITGGTYPAEIWGRYMRAWHEGKPEPATSEAAASTRGGRLPRSSPPEHRPRRHGVDASSPLVRRPSTIPTFTRCRPAPTVPPDSPPRPDRPDDACPTTEPTDAAPTRVPTGLPVRRLSDGGGAADGVPDER